MRMLALHCVHALPIRMTSVRSPRSSAHAIFRTVFSHCFRLLSSSTYCAPFSSTHVTACYMFLSGIVLTIAQGAASVALIARAANWCFTPECRYARNPLRHHGQAGSCFACAMRAPLICLYDGGIRRRFIGVYGEAEYPDAPGMLSADQERRCAEEWGDADAATSVRFRRRRDRRNGHVRCPDGRSGVRPRTNRW